MLLFRSVERTGQERAAFHRSGSVERNVNGRTENTVSWLLQAVVRMADQPSQIQCGNDDGWHQLPLLPNVFVYLFLLSDVNFTKKADWQECCELLAIADELRDFVRTLIREGSRYQEVRIFFHVRTRVGDRILGVPPALDQSRGEMGIFLRSDANAFRVPDGVRQPREEFVQDGRKLQSLERIFSW